MITVPGCYSIVTRSVLLLALLCAPLSTLADPALSAGLNPDVRLLIDISGSMKTSDPDNLRAPALDLIVRLLPDGAKAGVWIFGQNVNPIVEHRIVDDSWREEAQRAVAAIDNSGLRTNIPAAIKAALYDLDRLNPEYRTSIILLTDGKVDVSESPIANVNAAKSLLKDFAPELGATGIPVHTIALSDEADWTFLRSIAQATDGLAEKAESAVDLTSIFLQSLEMVAPSARVPVDNSSFQIDSTVEEFTALVFFETEEAIVGLVGPDGKRYRPDESAVGVEWFSNSQFALVTVDAPAAGMWRIEAPDNTRTRVTVISDLKLDVDPLPNNLPAGRISEMGLRLSDKGQVITDPEILSLFDIAIIIEDPDGVKSTVAVSSAYVLPQDGEYRVSIPAFEKAGRHNVLVSVSGETMQRELPMYVEVAAPPATRGFSSKGSEVPENEFQKPMLGMAALVALVLLIVMWMLYRSRQRKLALWQDRYQDGADDDPEGELLPGLSAVDDERS